MAKNEQKTTREDRLAAKLRENLRRRKAQAREIDDTAPEGEPKSGLSKSPEES